ncbi:MAG: NTP transferase domain-containing protein [Deltaproteobacteria bacterium]|jgi:hypothetical protein|nr:NTP transferase domain-containing protein [Deltaproteobacteria bacterium]
MAPVIDLLPPGESLKYFALQDAFTLNLKVALWAGLILAAPITLRIGTDKAFLRDNLGRLLLDQSAARLATWFGRVLLVTDEPKKLAHFTELAPYAALKDQHPLSGLVGAIRTALLASQAKRFLLRFLNEKKTSAEPLASCNAANLTHPIF